MQQFCVLHGTPQALLGEEERAGQDVGQAQLGLEDAPAGLRRTALPITTSRKVLWLLGRREN